VTTDREDIEMLKGGWLGLLFLYSRLG